MAEIYSGRVRYKIKLDFSEDTNPFGLPVRVKKAAVDSVEKWAKYSDPDCTLLRKKLSYHESVPFENIVCGNGASDLIYRIIAAFRPKTALICAPTIGEYKRALTQNGCRAVEHRLIEEKSFRLTTDLCDKINGKTDMVILCSPNHPTGEIVTAYTLSAIASRCLLTNTILVCDESFMDLVVDSAKYTAQRMMNEKMIIVRSFTQTYAMAGLRLGYAVFGSMDMAETVRATGQTRSIDVPAMAAGEAAVDEIVYVRVTRKAIAEERIYLTEALTELGLVVYPSKANFLLFRCELPLDKLLLKRGILIGSCDSYTGLGIGFFRISIRKHSENKQLIDAIRYELHL